MFTENKNAKYIIMLVIFILGEFFFLSSGLWTADARGIKDMNYNQTFGLCNYWNIKVVAEYYDSENNDLVVSMYTKTSDNSLTSDNGTSSDTSEIDINEEQTTVSTPNKFATVYEETSKDIMVYRGNPSKNVVLDYDIEDMPNNIYGQTLTIHNVPNNYYYIAIRVHGYTRKAETSVTIQYDEFGVEKEPADQQLENDSTHTVQIDYRNVPLLSEAEDD